MLDRVKKHGNKLYLEFGGKLCFDYHAARVLPGYDPNVKIRLLQQLKDKLDIVLCIYAGDIEKGRRRGDFGITYDAATLKLIDDLRNWGLNILAVVITRFANQSAAGIFKNKLERRGVKVNDRVVVEIARKAAQEAEIRGKGNQGIYCGAAIQLHDGKIITGKNSKLMHAASSLILNAVKARVNIPDEILLLSPQVINQISKLKEGVLNTDSQSLGLEETLIALSISATTNHTAEIAMNKLIELRSCEVHMTHIPRPGDEVGLKRLGVNLTSDGKFSSHNLFVS